MSIVSMLGFDQYPAVTSLPLTLLNPMWLGPGSSVPKYPLFTTGGVTNYSVTNQLAYGEATDTCNYIIPNITNSTTLSAAGNLCVLRPPTDITASDLDKTGNWYFGAMVQLTASSAGLTTSALAVLGDGTVANNVYFATYGVDANSGLVNGSTTVYIEIQIDWVNKMLYGYLNGFLRASKSFTTTPVVGIGNITSSSPYGTTSTNWVSGNSVGYWQRFSNIYWVIDKAGDANPTGRLGPVRVRLSPVSSVDVVGGMTTTDSGGSFVTPLASNAIALPLVTQYVGLDPYGQQGTVHFATPTLAGNSGKILAAQVSTTVFKPLEASANAEVALLNGTTEISRSVNTVTNTPTLISAVVNTAKDGSALLPASISDLTVKASSHRV